MFRPDAHLHIVADDRLQSGRFVDHFAQFEPFQAEDICRFLDFDLFPVDFAGAADAHPHEFQLAADRLLSERAQGSRQFASEPIATRGGIRFKFYFAEDLGVVVQKQAKGFGSSDIDSEAGFSWHSGRRSTNRQ